MNLSQAIDGFLLFKRAAGLRPRTLELYQHHLNQFVAWIGDPEVDTLDAAIIMAFLAYLRDEYRPVRANGVTEPLSTQSIYNAWTTLKSFTRWTASTLDVSDIMTGQVPRPRVQNEEQMPFTEDEVRRLLNVVKPHKHKRATTGLYYMTALRDQSIVMTLLDTGLRVGELCALTVGDLHVQSGRLAVHDGKGGKSRVVWLGAKTRPIVWRYLQEREALDPAVPLFPAANGRPLTASAVRKKLVALGARADVANSYPHRFRHTFAIQYLRNGGDVFTLQAILGHTTMTMVRRYLHLAASDVEQAHRRASPVDNWLR